MRNRGLIIAIELYKDRVPYLKTLLKRVGIDVADVIEGGAMKASEMLGKNIADKTLLDPPRSSSGVLANHGEAEIRRREINEIDRTTEITSKSRHRVVEMWWQASLLRL